MKSLQSFALSIVILLTSAPAARAQTILPNAGLTEAVGQLDPRLNGWESEAISATAQRHQVQLGRIIKGDEIDTSQFIDEEVRSSTLLPRTLTKTDVGAEVPGLAQAPRDLGRQRQSAFNASTTTGDGASQACTSIWMPLSAWI